MKQGWEIKKLGEVCEIVGGSTPKTTESSYWDGEHYWVTPAVLDGAKYISSTSRTITDAGVKSAHLQLLPIGTVLLSSRAPIGKVAITTVPMYCNQGFKNLICSDKLYNEFAYWFLYHNTEYLNSLGTGATFKEISKRVVEQISIPIPPYAEQERIVGILDREFERIDALKANAEQNLQHAKDLFQAALKQELQPKEGWKSQTFSDEVDVINGRAYRKEELLSKGKYRVLRVGNFFTNDSWYYSDLELSDDKYCDYGDLLYAWSASFGPKIWKGEKVIYHYHIWKMVSKNGIDTHFLYYWLQSPHLTTQVMSNLHGTTMAHITKGIMESTTIQFPEKQEQNAVVARLDKLKEHCKALEENYTKTIALCDDMKQALLRKAFNGEL